MAIKHSIRLVCLAAACMLLANFIGSATSTVLAVEAPKPVRSGKSPGYEDRQFASDNYSPFSSNECTPDGGGSSVGAVQLNGNDNTEKILSFYMGKGLNLAQAAGIVGNMMQESQLRPELIQGMSVADKDYVPVNGTGFGLVQWTFTARQKPLTDHMKQYGSIIDLGGQLEFTWVELNGQWLTTLNKLRTTNDPVDAAIIVHGNTSHTQGHPRFAALNLTGPGYEASGDSGDEVITKRGAVAQQVYDKYKDAPALAGSTASDSGATAAASSGCSQSGGSNFAGGNFAETVKAYAWPNYRGNTLEMQPAYVETIKKSRETPGMYVGDGRGDWGVDCGVFVTHLIRDSGFDKGYNFDGKGGATGEQYKWTSENWQNLGDASSIDPSTLQPGDVANNQSSHTFVFVGKIDGFESTMASASWGERAPMADTAQSPTQSGYTWFRKKS